MSGGVGRTSKADDSISAPRGKRHKRFLEKKDALSLAVSIAEAQEEKAQTKAEKHHKIQVVDDQKNERKLPSSTKAKLKEVKAALASKRACAKKERAKSRRERQQGEAESGRDLVSSGNASKPARKSVSFA